MLLLCSALATGCSGPPGDVLVLATTTSVDDSGLLAHLIESYHQQAPDAAIRPLAVGSGEALELGRRRDADLLIVHHRALEEAFVADGHGERRVPFMYNDFVIVGPGSDPAGVRAAGSAAAALRSIAETGHLFLSRGDNSGTHGRELEIWKAAGTVPSEPWYLEAGQGMGPLLQMASERGGYALSDRATFYSMEPRLDLVIVSEGDSALRNVYSAIVVRGSRAEPAAREFLSWLTSADGRRAVDGFRDGSGRPLFHSIRPDEALRTPIRPDEGDVGDRGSVRPVSRADARAAPLADDPPASLRARFLCRSVPPAHAGPQCG